VSRYFLLGQNLAPPWRPVNPCARAPKKMSAFQSRWPAGTNSRHLGNYFGQFRFFVVFSIPTFMLLFHIKSYALNLTLHVLGNFMGDFSFKTPGHRVSNRRQHGRLAITSLKIRNNSYLRRKAGRRRLFGCCEFFTRGLQHRRVARYQVAWWMQKISDGEKRSPIG
jgi:hypothetical protein